MYTPLKVDISDNQNGKLKAAIKRKKAVSIRIKTSSNGRHTILLTTSQKHRLERARLIGKADVNIKLSRKQIIANLKHEGGFLSMLAGLAAKALPTLLGGLATGLISGGIEKAIGGSGIRRSGNGLFLHKSGHCVKIRPIKGRGLELTPQRRPVGIFGEGIFLKHGSRIYDGRGLLLGKNSPFKNIPIIGLLL